MNVTFKQLRAFVAVAEAQGFSLAASRLHLTPGAVSLLVRDLEAELGFSLFERTTRRVSLTRAGCAYLPNARKVLQEVRAAGLSAQDIRNRMTGVVRVAAPLIIASSVLPPLIAAYRQQQPAIQVRPVDCAVKDLANHVVQDQADLAIGPDGSLGEGVRTVSLFPSPWVLWCRPDHPLASRQRVSWSSLREESVIAAGRDYEQHLAAASAQHSRPVEFAPSYFVENITTAIGMTAAGLGITLSPEYVGTLAHGAGLVARQVGPPELLREVCLYLPGQRSMSPAAATFARFVQEQLCQESAPRSPPTDSQPET